MSPQPLPCGLIVSCQVHLDNPFSTPQRVAAAFGVGAHAVVVGTAITNPRTVARTLAGAVPESR